jgi:hypothetical protein
MSWWGRLFGKSMSQRPVARHTRLVVNLNESQVGQVSKRLEAILPPGWSEHPCPSTACVALLVRDRSRTRGKSEKIKAAND